MQEEEKKSPYRPLNIVERDTLFAFYEKHRGNILKMTRDRECTHHSHAQIRYYRDLYGFEAQLDEIRQRKAKEIVSRLTEAKLDVLRRAMDIVETRQIPLTDREGKGFTDADGQPIWVEVTPDHKAVKTAWEIIKTELGEATSIGKHDLTSKGESINTSPETVALATKALDTFINGKNTRTTSTGQ